MRVSPSDPFAYHGAGIENVTLYSPLELQDQITDILI